MESGNRAAAVSHLKSLTSSGDLGFRRMVGEREAVLAKFGSMFGLERLPGLTAPELREFLQYGHKRQWWGIRLPQEAESADLGVVRHALAVLVDENRPLVDRLGWIMGDSGPKPIPWLVPAVITPILHLTHPDDYGVWNSISEAAMLELGLVPSVKGMPTFGRKYLVINAELLKVAAEIGVDLWTLDALWRLAGRKRKPRRQGGGSRVAATAGRARKAPTMSTFVCTVCFGSKADHLRSGETDICIDCDEPRD